MESLPDDVWFQILQIGCEARRLNHADLCSLAMVNTRFDQLTQDPTLWATLLSHDFFPFSRFCDAPSKALYREKHQKERESEFEYYWTFRVTSQSNFSQTPIQINHGRWLSSLELHAEVPPRRYFSQTPIEIIGGGISNLVVHAGSPPRRPRAPVLSRDHGSSLRQAHNNYYENQLIKRSDKASRQKAVPTPKSYIPMNKPPRRSMPRKI